MAPSDTPTALDAPATPRAASRPPSHPRPAELPGRVAPPRPRGVPAPRAALAIPLGILVAATCAGCGSLLTAGTAEIAGIGGAAIAGAVTENAAAATGIGLGVQALGRAGLQHAQRRVRRTAQDRIAQVAGPLAPGAVATWETDPPLRLERAERGRVTVSRAFGGAGLQCKEIVFSVDSIEGEDRADAGRVRSSFYVAAICQDGAQWRWASAEPATERWGALQ